MCINCILAEIRKERIRAVLDMSMEHISDTDEWILNAANDLADEIYNGHFADKQRGEMLGFVAINFLQRMVAMMDRQKHNDG
jgi:hypothetical protein